MSLPASVPLKKTPLNARHRTLGARMVGGGFGGSAIALCEDDRVDSVRQAVADAAARRDLPAPTFLRATASGGARRC